jgi:hypothetical protein
METLKLIPQVFFDLIARVIPGAIGIISYLVLCEKNWQFIITYLFGPTFAENSTTLSFLIFLGTGYVVGELISPFAKMVQRINEIGILKTIGEVIKRIRNILKIMIYKELRKRIRKIRKLKLKNKKEKLDEKKLRYDRLRVEKPDVGALCAKIRAEFTMHNGLAVIFAVSALCYPFSVLPFHWYVLTFFLFMTIMTAHRGRTTNSTFNETVAKFTQVLNEDNSTTK